MPLTYLGMAGGTTPTADDDKEDDWIQVPDMVRLDTMEWVGWDIADDYAVVLQKQCTQLSGKNALSDGGNIGNFKKNGHPDTYPGPGI